MNDALGSLSEVTDPPDEDEEEVDEYAPGAIDPELKADLLEEEMARRAVEVESASYAVSIFALC